MNIATDVARSRSGARDAVTWYCYLLLGYFTFMVSIQGNIMPFLKSELDLSYRAVSLHTSAIAAGVILVGLFGERIVRHFGRRRMLAIGALGSAAAMVILTLAGSTWASLGGTFLFGVLGGFIPAMNPAILSDLHGPRRDVAIAEANAVAYVFAVMAPALTALCVWLALDWRLAVLAGVASALVIVAAYARYPVPASLQSRESAAAPLPPAYWCYWAMLGMSVAAEFSILLWAPAFLEQVGGLSAGSAALGTAAFFAGMLIGRVGGTALYGVIATRHLFFASAVATLAGFAAYWGSGLPAVSIAGLFVVGLGIALLFPLSLGFAMGAANHAADRAAARVMLGPGSAILLSPPLLGAIADSAGLRLAQSMTPVFMVLAIVAFLAGQVAERRAR